MKMVLLNLIFLYCSTGKVDTFLVKKRTNLTNEYLIVSKRRLLVTQTLLLIIYHILDVSLALTSASLIEKKKSTTRDVIFAARHK